MRAIQYDPTIVAYGAAFLAPLPIEALFAAVDADQELVATLRRWGIRRIGELATLPSGGVALRLGAGGARLAQIARGEAGEALVPRPEPLVFEEGLELDWPVEDLGGLVFVVRRLVENLVARLTCRGLSASGLTVQLKLDRGWVDPTARAGAGTEVRSVSVAAPTRHVPTLVELARLALERTPPTGPVTALSVQLAPSRARPSQLAFFEPAGPSPDKLATTLARLAALVGEDRVGSPQLPDSHLNVFTLAKFQPPPAIESGKPLGTPPKSILGASPPRGRHLASLRSARRWSNRCARWRCTRCARRRMPRCSSIAATHVI